MMVVFTIAIAALYALPNIYGEDPAIQITGARGASVNMSTLDSVTQALEKKSLSYKSIALEDGSILVRFNDPDAQISAKDVINEALGRDNIVALNLAPATPTHPHTGHIAHSSTDDSLYEGNSYPKDQQGL